ncbi:glycosyltransferase family 1 protein [Senegalia massiliensis]|uniref:glycosyltransferase family 1 protein n=1 Tax=Senegalia massiliensis TaxID=1720316 RepID=UPI001031F888|nr:glycosyltransferase family 1 protein [Senegalia massiliensis]
MKRKRCIFHIPLNIDEDSPISGSSIRPLKMLNAFKDIGYDVDAVMGDGKKRRKQFKKIENNIENGIKYDFLYSESSTMPTLLTEKNHFPKYPFLDFSYFKNFKNKRIPIGLFYRDIYWAFETYMKENGKLKGNIAKFFYKYDLLKYNQLLDIFYLPSIEMKDYIPKSLSVDIRSLPPGIDNKEHEGLDNKMYPKEKLNIFYVGGIGDLYNLEKIVKAISRDDRFSLTICCRKKEWEINASRYIKYLNNNIKIIHKSGDDLLPYFKKADMTNLYFKPVEYRKFAVPVKLFEYMLHKRPIIGTEDTFTGKYTKGKNIGWEIPYNDIEIKKILNYIYENQLELVDKSNNMAKLIKENTWNARARQVRDDLLEFRGE